MSLLWLLLLPVVVSAVLVVAGHRHPARHTESDRLRERQAMRAARR